MVVVRSFAAEPFNGVKSLIYGGAGVGKTRLCATAPAPFVFSCEGGTLSIRRERHVFGDYIATIRDLEDGLRWAQSSYEARYFQTICLDSASEIMEVLLEAEKRNNRDPRKAYGEILVKGLKCFRDFRDLPQKNVVIIAKEEWAKDEIMGNMVYQPSFPGSKLGPALPYFPDEVFRLIAWTDPQSRQTTTALRCRADQQCVAKDRSGALQEFEPPNLTEVFTKIWQHTTMPPEGYAAQTPQGY